MNKHTALFAMFIATTGLLSGCAVDEACAPDDIACEAPDNQAQFELEENEVIVYRNALKQVSKRLAAYESSKQDAFNAAEYSALEMVALASRGDDVTCGKVVTIDEHGNAKTTPLSCSLPTSDDPAVKALRSLVERLGSNADLFGFEHDVLDLVDQRIMPMLDPNIDFAALAKLARAPQKSAALHPAQERLLAASQGAMKNCPDHLCTPAVTKTVEHNNPAAH